MINFRIIEVEIKNFRGYKYQTFNFESNDQLIILGGPNGYGKTSFIDAIEWCLTGDVRRISDEVKARKESNLSIMKKGLIQHKNAGNEPVSVQLKIILNGVLLTIKRVSKRNATTYLRDDTTVTITKSEGVQGDSIDEIFNGNFSITENFYDHFICSHDKNLKIYEKGRKDLYDLFKLYLGSNSSIEYIQQKLDKALNDINERIKQLTSEQEIVDKLLERETKSEDIQGAVDKYNDLHPEDRITIEGLSKKLTDFEEKRENINKLISLKRASELNQEYILHKEFRILKNKYDKFKKDIYNVYPQNAELINLVKNYEYSNVIKEISKINEFLLEIEGLREQFPIACNLMELLRKIDFINEERKVDIFLKIEEINKLEEEYSKLSQIINESKNQSELTQAINTLVASSKVWYEYVEHKHECPLCRRPNLSLEEIKHAIDITLNELDSKARIVSQSIERQKETQKQIMLFSNKIISTLLEITKKQYDDLIGIKNAFDLVNDYLKECEIYGIKAEELNQEAIDKKLKILFDDQDKHIGGKYSDYLLTDLVTLNNQIEENEKIIKDSGIDYEYIISLDKAALLNEQALLNKIIEFISHSENIQKKKRISEELTLLDVKSKEINGIKTKVSQSEGQYEAQISKKLESVINTIYRKINRHTNFEELTIRRPGTKATNLEVLIDSDTNFSNVMSTGQITSVALSFFIGLALTENSSKFKAYFMDDPIQSLDDVNVLSFVDLLRTQFRSSNRFAEQIFITTCDEDFKDLLEYKMKHYEIGVKHLKFMDYGKYIVE
ncbi:MAG TPA: AAA family ATPase [Defluviitaleaceae bacterium]|nr:AAA family ATPase [Defluviitaleaceae bacterium]